MTILRRPGRLLLAWAVSTIIIIWAAPGYSVTPRLYTMDRDGEYIPVAGEVYAMPVSGATDDDDDAIEPVPLSQYHTLSRAAGLGLMVTVAAYICLADCLSFKGKGDRHAGT